MDVALPAAIERAATELCDDYYNKADFIVSIGHDEKNTIYIYTKGKPPEDAVAEYKNYKVQYRECGSIKPC